MGFELPVNLVRDVEADDRPELARQQWLDALPGVVAELSRRWSLQVGRPYQPGGCYSWVAPAVDRSGARVVLKLGWRHSDAEHEAEGLQDWQAHGVVRLIDAVKQYERRSRHR